MDRYHYVGPPEIAERTAGQPHGTPIRTPQDVIRWAKQSDQPPGTVIVTFVIDSEGELRIADRHSEHVACAGGQTVRSAGEMTFDVGKTATVVAVSNQSTGYCPEPESWPAVEAALRRAGFDPPVGFNPTCVFRLCPMCGVKNLVKGGEFECGACGADLPAEYNCQD